METQQQQGTPGAIFEEGEEGFVVDLSGADENQAYPVLPRGIYPCVVDDLTYGLSQASGNPMWTWVLEVEEGDHAGHKLYFHTPFTEKTASRVKRVLTRVAPELANVRFKPEEIAEQGIMVGKRLKARVDIRKYEGQDRNNVRDILPPDGEAGGTPSFL